MTMSEASRRKTRAAVTSLVIGTIIFATKLTAWALTGSTAILSDALESVVNVAAAVFAVYAVRWGSQPADRDHPYGHGKIEHLSAAFEGGLVFFAAITVAYAGVRALVVGPELRRLDVGLSLTVVAALANLGLGLWLLRVGKRVGSPALEADGHHVLSDVWTTLGAIVALVVVRFTGIGWLDAATALALGLLLSRTGVKLVMESAQSLLDREDVELLQRIVLTFNEARVPGLFGMHRLRTIRAGEFIHVDAHVFVPASWTVREAHVAAAELEAAVKASVGEHGEIALHLDPSDVDPSRYDGELTVEAAVGAPVRYERATSDAPGPADAPRL